MAKCWDIALRPRPAIWGKMNQIQWLVLRPSTQLGQDGLVVAVLLADEPLQIVRHWRWRPLLLDLAQKVREDLQPGRDRRGLALHPRPTVAVDRQLGLDATEFGQLAGLRLEQEALDDGDPVGVDREGHRWLLHGSECRWGAASRSTRRHRRDARAAGSGIAIRADLLTQIVARASPSAPSAETKTALSRRYRS